METMNKDYFKKLANQIMFDLSDNEISELQEEFEILLRQIDLLERIDTEGVEEMVYPFEQETSFMRDDEVDHALSQEEALSNVMTVKMGHVQIPKVVK